MKTHKLFTKDECSLIIKEIGEKYVSYHNRRDYGVDNSSYNKTDLNPDSWYYNRIKDYINTELKYDHDVNGTLVLLTYNKGDKFPVHVDKVVGSEYHEDFIYNINIVLNDEYEGGEFTILGKEYKEPAGTIYYYKSNTPHGVNEITNGERYVLLYHIRERDIRKKQTLI